MEAAAEKERGGVGVLQVANRHDHDLVHELSDRLSALWRYGECVANAEGEPEAQQIWRNLQLEELASIRQLKQEIVGRIQRGEFLEDL